jgi:hypothetical protein
MAIGVIWVLLIIVTSLAMTYIREWKLSRFSYDEVLVQTQSEWMFEYGMLKMANHRDGFQDQTFSWETDGNILDLSTSRSKWLYSEYNIIASSKNSKFTLSGSEHLIIPLFVSTGSTKIGALSLHPKYNTGTANTEWLNISGIDWLGWTIVAMSGSESVAITGVGIINTSSNGSIRIKRTKCLSVNDGTEKINCLGLSPGDEEIQYVYDKDIQIKDFLLSKKEPYLVIYNSNASSVVPINIIISSSTPFSLPQSEITTKALKWWSSQVFKFIQDKSKYYDALKYGIYNNDP